MRSGWLCLVLAACSGGSHPAADATVDVALDAPGPPTNLTVTIIGSSSAFIHVTSLPSGIDCTTSGPTCTAQFPGDSKVTLTGDGGGCFAWNWSACAPGTGSSCTLTLHTEMTVNVNCASAAN